MPGLNDYNNIKLNPMDISTIKDKLRLNYYCNILDLVTDIRLVYNNAILYNPDAVSSVLCCGKMLGIY